MPWSLLGLAYSYYLFITSHQENALPAAVRTESGLITTIEYYNFRDLNKNGKMDVYEDPNQPIELRIKDLLQANDAGRESRYDVLSAGAGECRWFYRRQTSGRWHVCLCSQCLKTH